MLQNLRNRAAEEKGFTLIELLVVILIIGILAAIALPVFLGQQEKGQDAAAKADARNAYSQVEACYADTQDYTLCTPAELPVSKTGFTFGATTAANDNSIKLETTVRPVAFLSAGSMVSRLVLVASVYFWLSVKYVSIAV